MNTYKIVRSYHPAEDKPDKLIKTGLTLEEAQSHCRDPETSSNTASPETCAASPGQWFDSYDEE